MTDITKFLPPARSKHKHVRKQVSVSEQTHRSLRAMATKHGVSINAVIAALLAVYDTSDSEGNTRA